ncbi:MAG: hypothetical protein U5K72_10155 [Balneolaceae bacterium]|nr:hypothetical protein [Balneolaceae bacterium]
MAPDKEKTPDAGYLSGSSEKKSLESDFSDKNINHNDSDNEQLSITERLKNLPKIKAGKQFDQKMAASFAIELQKEAIQRNKSWLEKKPQIYLPDIVTDLTKNFL